MLRVASSIRRTKPRVILCHSHRHAIAGVIGQLLSGRRPRLIVVEHQSIHLRSTKDNLLSGLAVAVSRGVVFLTQQYQQQYQLRRIQRILRRPGFVVPNGIEVSGRWASSETRPGSVDPSAKTIGMASRLVPSKQHDVLIRAIHILNQRSGHERVHLLVAGEGPTMSQLALLAEELGVAEFVHFLGHIPVSKVPEFLGELDVYAHATLGEGFSIALLEAAEAGVPIVVSDVPGVNGFFVDGETAVLVPPSDPHAMASGIAQVLEPYVGARLAGAARHWVLSNYSADRIAARYLAVLKTVDPGGAW
ncbi:glycosyltransferase family 4 protein [bacterium]|nr:glycosyltransferase family 4 protein [bacterium]